jgi:hypothetical protein
LEYFMFKKTVGAAVGAAMLLCILPGCATTAAANNPATAAHAYSACAPHPSSYDCQAERYLNVD